ncbi:hypothetical protein AAFF_G00072980 [Aldrovandia affinis]|uniref:Uncharacterized protein n=1 Tax=Aldrovandia affinis TaxID=143900 RepID=A0AAD7WE53_9TELE|nr:hypothetical protein AAFF_G00072980 [Aldrovandia affinis]
MSAYKLPSACYGSVTVPNNSPSAVQVPARRRLPDTASPDSGVPALQPRHHHQPVAELLQLIQPALPPPVSSTPSSTPPPTTTEGSEALETPDMDFRLCGL